MSHPVRDPDRVREKYLRLVDTSAYERDQLEHTMTVIVWLTLAVGLILTGVNVWAADWFTAATVATLSALCLPILWISRRFSHRVAGGLLNGLILLVTSAALLEAEGLHNPGLMAYPICVIMGGVLLGKRALVSLSLVAMGLLGGIAWLEIEGHVHSFHPLDFDHLMTIAVLMAASVFVAWVTQDNVEKDIESIRRSEAKALEAYEQTLEAWSRALEYRDEETEGHSRRVAELGVRLAQALGCNGGEITRIRWGALLHDIGKLAVPDQILRKPGPLTDEEMEVMRQHPIFAVKMLAEIPFLRPVVSIPYCHHERWDGGGYPEGLKGEEIPLPARIFAVVDQWEALTSPRIYRRAWPRDAVIEYMRRNAGKIYDPAVLDVFLRDVVGAEES